MKIQETLILGRDFKRIFGVDLKPFLDTTFFMIGEVLIDIIKFDDYMLEKYPKYKAAYENDEMSLSDFITQEFGADADALMNKLLS